MQGPVQVTVSEKTELGLPTRSQEPSPTPFLNFCCADRIEVGQAGRQELVGNMGCPMCWLLSFHMGHSWLGLLLLWAIACKSAGL